MKPYVPILTIALLSAARADTAPDCARSLAQARAQQVAVAEWQAGRRVAGQQRVYFHSAPERNCRLRETFVVPGDSVYALHEYATFTEVQYQHPRTGKLTLGWVDSGRLEETIAVR